MYLTLIKVDPSSSPSDHHGLVNSVFYGQQTTGTCPKFVSLGEFLQVFSKEPPAHPEMAVSVKEYVPPTGDITIVTTAVALRKVDGRHIPYEKGTEHRRMIEKFKECLSRHGIPVIERNPNLPEEPYDYFSCRFAGTVTESRINKNHKFAMTMPKVKILAEVHCDDASALESLILSGFGNFKYLGLGAIIVSPRKRKCDDSQS